MPCKKITIGNPHFYERIKKYRHIKEQRDTILIVSQGTLTKKFVKIKYLANNLQGFKIIFKLHPREGPFENRYEELKTYDNIRIVKSGDIYELIAKCENIVAFYSTVIFETLGFNKKRFILDNDLSKEAIPRDIGLWFKKNEDLKKLIQKNKNQKNNFNLEYYFSSNWKKNFKKFMEEKICFI